VGHYVPERVVTNADLVALMDTSHEWIVERTGIEERRFAKIGEDTVSSMGVKAARMALERANISADEVDFIVFACVSADYFFPGAGVMVQRDLCPNRTIGALDIRDQCSGFVYGLSVADQFIRTGMYKTILVIGSEIQSTGLDLSTRGRNTAVIFGDGAGAVVLQRTDDADKGLYSTHLHSQGEFAEKLFLHSPGTLHDKLIYEGIETDIENTYPYMDGSFVFKHAVTRFQEVIVEALAANNFTLADLDMFVPHQANLRITQFVQRLMKLTDDKVYSNVQRYGNTTAATIPIALSELWEQGRLLDGDLVVLAAFGSGFTWASAIMRW
jgi:3-oxoacyl-[acyl-carrier-protein] synthase-3